MEESKKLDLIAYMRVSKQSGMTVENQRPVIESWIAANKEVVNSVKWVIEEMSTRKRREQEEWVYQAIINKEYNGLIFVRLDRWGRSLIELVNTVNGMVNAGARIIIVSNGMDLTRDNYDASSRMMIGVLAVFAEYERALIQERTNDGLDRARSEGKRLGRPTGSKDKKERRKSGYFVRWDKKKHPKKYTHSVNNPVNNVLPSSE